MATNGKSRLIMWLGGCLFTVIVVITLPALANNIIQNDIRNTEEHTRIRIEAKKDKEEVINKMQNGFDSIHKEQQKLAVQMARIEAILLKYQ